MQLLLTCLTSNPGKSWLASTVESVDKVSACSVVKTWIAPTLVYICQLNEYLINYSFPFVHNKSANAHRLQRYKLSRRSVFKRGLTQTAV